MPCMPSRQMEREFPDWRFDQASVEIGMREDKRDRDYSGFELSIQQTSMSFVAEIAAAVVARVMQYIRPAMEGRSTSDTVRLVHRRGCDGNLPHSFQSRRNRNFRNA